MLYRFGDCELDTVAHRLWVGGEERAVEPRVFDMLVLLVSRAGELVSQDDMIAALWEGRAISESAISACISTARSAIGDDGKRQELIRTVPRRGFRFAAPVETLDHSPDETARTSSGARPDVAPLRQHVRFCTSGDGTRIAFATTGSGPPLVRAGHWLTHLEHDRQSPLWNPMLTELETRFSLTRYDQRGNGLSDWDAEDLDLDRFVDDLEAVVDAAGLDRFAIYGTSQGAPIAIGFAARHPGRVSRLVLHGGYIRGRLVRDLADREAGEAIIALIRHGWGQPGSAFLTAFSSMFLPGGTREQIDSLAELQAVTTSAENAARLRAAIDAFDVREAAARLDLPTLVIHARDDGVHPLSEGRNLASAISGAEFVMLESRNHVILPGDPAWPVLLDELTEFVGAGTGPSVSKR